MAWELCKKRGGRSRNVEREGEGRRGFGSGFSLSRLQNRGRAVQPLQITGSDPDRYDLQPCTLHLDP